MSSGLLDPLRRNIGLRLSLFYALIFTVSSVALLALAYYLLAAAIGSKDREVLEARLKEAAVVYEAGGVNALRGWVRSQPVQVQNTMFVHLVNPLNNSDLVISAPQDTLPPYSQEHGTGLHLGPRRAAGPLVPANRPND
jgi:hypothetical protein